MSQPHDPIDQHWADLLSPGRRQLLRAGGLAAAGGLIGAPAFAAALPSSPAAIAAHTGKSPWGLSLIHI